MKKIRKYVLRKGKLEEIWVAESKFTKEIQRMLKRDKDWLDILAKL